MGWSEMEGRCRKHPKHRQSKGVCPSCLREKLSQLSASSSTHNSAIFSSPGTSYDSASSSVPSSSPGTPSAIQNHRRRHVAKKLAFLMKENKENPLLGRAAREPLTKSRSLAFVISNPLGGGKKEKKKGKADALGEEEEKEEEDKGEEVEKEEEKNQQKKKKKRGFWSKLAVGGKKRKEKDALFHSKTVRETSSARWAFLP
ncbi:hypothetical protein Taro_048400 [Colocasia esculenta]|uniref:Uncharacterized protein n=1 Tax=Colocasia esculenta TaxID=4460 RepID=A0A843X7U9_COLES|nr:hypothetical protein [Colocasia esculenta]